MNLSVSNLAWDHKDLDVTLNILEKYNIKNIEGVLSKINKWDKIDNTQLINFKNVLETFGVKIPSIQSIFYNVNIDSLNNKNKFVQHINKLIEFSKTLEFDVLVFGSPNLRNNFHFNTIVDVLTDVNKLLSENGIIMCIEPNSKIYNGEYFNTITEIINFLNLNNFSNIKTMIDTHNLLLESEDPIEIIEKYYNHIYHIHISENKLLPLSDLEFHKKFSEKIKSLGYENIITYELLPCDNLEEKIKVFTKIYN
jgi:D-psicose/D-tagatose/L-ribulose 3-epimerase